MNAENALTKTMKLSEIISKLTGHDKALAELSADKSKATDFALASLSAEIAALKSGAVSELTQANSDLATAKASVASLTANLEKAQGEVNALGGNLKTACTSMGLEAKEGATSADMITAIQGGVSTTLAKLNIKSSAIPAAKPATSPAGESKTKTMAEYHQMNPVEASNFFKGGGKLVD